MASTCEKISCEIPPIGAIIQFCHIGIPNFFHLTVKLGIGLGTSK